MGRKKINEIGNVYSDLIVISEVPSKKNGCLWLCKCDCGNQVIVKGTDLRSGNVKSCGCLSRGITTINEMCNRYGRLVVIGESPTRDNRGNIMWVCRCDCGNQVVVSGSSLRHGNTKSCKCLHRDILSAQGKKRTGIKNPNFTTGQRINYGKKLYRDFHAYIRKRDNYICQECGRSQEDELRGTGRKLDIHHKDGDHWNNTDDNAVTLCIECHTKTTRANQRQRDIQMALEISIRVAEENIQ